MTTAGVPIRLVVPTSAVTWDEIGGEIVAINLASGHYHSLRETARDVFVLLDAGATLPDIATRLAPAPDDVFRVGADLERFVADLLAAGLAQPAGDGAVGSTEPTVELDALVTGDRAYAAPVLETFTDLEDLMLLDPVHDVDEQGWPRADVDG
jgi:hypothetical protein